MDFPRVRSIGDVIKDRNIILRGADAASRRGFTQVPNFLLTMPNLSPGDKLTFAMLLSYAWQNNYCFPGQERLAEDMGVSDRSIRTHLSALVANGLLAIRRRGQGKTNVYELNLKPMRRGAGADRKKTSGLDRKERSALERKGTSGPL